MNHHNEETEYQIDQTTSQQQTEKGAHVPHLLLHTEQRHWVFEIRILFLISHKRVPHPHW